MHDNTNNHPILNSYGWFILIVNMAFSIINLVAVCVNYPRWEKLSFDYLGVIVGILSILVTILLGWQIFINISMEKKIDKKIHEAQIKMIKRINDKVYDVSLEIEDKRQASIVVSLYQSSCSAYLLKKYDFALWLSLDSMLHYNKIKKKQTAFENNEYDNILETLRMCIQSVPKVYFLNKEQINEYIEVAQDLKLLDIACYLSHNSISNNNSSSNYIMNISSDTLSEKIEFDYKENNGNSFISEN